MQQLIGIAGKLYLCGAKAELVGTLMFTGSQKTINGLFNNRKDSSGLRVCYKVLDSCIEANTCMEPGEPVSLLDETCAVKHNPSIDLVG